MCFANPYKKLSVYLIYCILMIIWLTTTNECYAQTKNTSLYQLDSATQMRVDPTSNLQNFSNLFFQNSNKQSHHNLNRPISWKPMHGGSCGDTSSRISIVKDSFSFSTRFPCLARDGNLLISGNCGNYLQSNRQAGGYIVKSDIYGNAIWSKFYDSINHIQNNFINYYNLLELIDGGILLAGFVYDGPSGNQDILLTKVDANGNVIWSKDYYSRKWGQGSGTTDFFESKCLKQDPVSGDLYILSPSIIDGVYVIKLDASNGNIIWSNMYNPQGFSADPGGIIFKDDALIIVGSSIDNFYSYIFACKIDKTNGDTIFTRSLSVTDTLAKGFTDLHELQELGQGQFALSGQLRGHFRFMYDGTVPLYQAGVVILDTNFNFISGYSFLNNILSNSFNTTTVYPDGTGLFTMFHYLTNNTGDWYYTEFDNGSILRERVCHGQNYQNPNRSIQISNRGNMMVSNVIDSVDRHSTVVITKMHLSDTSSDCLGHTTNNTFIEPILYGNPWYVRDSIKRNVILERRVIEITASPLALGNPQPFCKQLSFCDTVKLTLSANTTCPNTPVTVIARKNKECGSPVRFDLDTAALKSFTVINDSTYELVFKTAWQGYLHASIEGCTLHSDSVALTVFPAVTSLWLGNDADICPGNQIVLNAHDGFSSYLWQDRSTDSTFTATAPGTYHVTVSNSCIGQLTDTIIINAHMPAPFWIGNDTTICKGSIATLTAPSGFTNYQWSAAVPVPNPGNMSVQVNPSSNTDYIAKAEESANCFVYDTVSVIVKPVPAIQLGNDTSFCQGGHVLLNAGPGFVQYNWSDGSTQQSLQVSQIGEYRVTGTTPDNCIATDTFDVVDVFPPPVVNLGSDSIICINSNRILDAGAFRNYAWNNGASSQTITVNDTGLYILHVTDSHYCAGTGSLHITLKATLPSGFLPGDTLVCNYGTTRLQTTKKFAAYLWSTGQNSSYIDVAEAGQYWLQATDINHCIGTDSINISKKQCLEGLYVPTAFSPNNDASNDGFAPRLFGNAIYFDFTVYNRYGQTVFSSNSQATKWDGTFKGKAQPSGTYVWICNYQLAGKMHQIKKGTVVLIR